MKKSYCRSNGPPAVELAYEQVPAVLERSGSATWYEKVCCVAVDHTVAVKADVVLVL